MRVASSTRPACAAPWRGTQILRHAARLAGVCACLLLAACASADFKRCEVSVQSVRASREAPARLLGTLLGAMSGKGGSALPAGLAQSLQLLVTLKVTNPNDRSVEIVGLTGTISTVDGPLGAFRLPPGKTATLPAEGAASLDVEVQPDEAALRAALPLLFSSGVRPEVKASGQVEVSTWLGVRRIPFNGVTIIRTNAPAASPPGSGTEPGTGPGAGTL